ncbi:hypothetical protein ABPG77_003586 [Micractinium sp. CCAP 211/92]
MTEPSCQLACDAQCDLGEAPVWDERNGGRVYFVDINGKRIHVFEPDTGAHRSIQLDQPVATIVPTSDFNKLLAALERDIVEVDVESGKVTRVLATTPEEHGIANYRFNDGKVSPQGSLLVGRMHSKWRDGNRGRLYALHPGSSQLQEGIMKRGPDGKLLARPYGNLWVALGESGSVVCYSAATGTLGGAAAGGAAGAAPTACTFGGPQLEHLYVTTRVETGEDASPHHGGLFRITIPGVKGVAPAYKFPL